ncbi:hypothetical protein BW730_16425 [Tessaracoccus aquimaris]|uniref:Uncharacterized protein n=1 Tax=Tessaracoccus aquimaris TaxID=1332264 RepID=A0A1Q2CRU4_9ACTN|nr:hypothetical protein [Tessaracoccus aquimaris]AQP48843.1 hypothetical protein BW730_16425 [Tessaracoccus aquimaris]
MDDPETDALRSLMRRAADDRSITAPNLLPLAAKARTRRRIGGVALVTALTVGGVAFGAGSMRPATMVASPAPATPAPTQETSPSEATNRLTPEAVTQRCRPQLDAYDGKPGYETPPGESIAWAIAHSDQRYSTGDPVLFVDPAGRSSERLCIVPEPGDTTSAIPDPAPSIADPQRLAALCSQQLRRYDGAPFEEGAGRSYDFRTPDLRAATLVNAAEKDGIVTALLLLEETYYACDVSGLRPYGMAQAATESPTLRPGDEFWGISASYFLPGGGKVDDPSIKPYEVGSGLVPVEGATSMRVDGQYTVDIVDGTYSFVVTRQPKSSGRLVVEYLDARGDVLFTSDSEGGRPYVIP